MPPDEARDAELARALAELKRVVITEHTLEDLLGQVVTLARSTVHGVDGASVSLREDGALFTSNMTDDVVRELDVVQYEHNDGPCVEAIRRGRQISVSLKREPDRYPRFSEAAQQRFMTAVLSTPFLVRTGPIGALNLYSATVPAFGEEQGTAAALFATQTSSLLANASALALSTLTNVNLERALQSRDLIGQAKGLLMERHGCSADEAFDVLRRESQRRNEKLVDIATQLVAGALTITGREAEPSAEFDGTD